MAIIAKYKLRFENIYMYSFTSNYFLLYNYHFKAEGLDHSK
jgi:hypothetical protein